MKKFEEGIFSDLRNLKPGVDASLEEPKVSFSSDFFLFVRCHVGVQAALTRSSCLLFGMSQAGERGGIKCVVQALAIMLLYTVSSFFRKEGTFLPTPPWLPAQKKQKLRLSRWDLGLRHIACV